MPEISLQEFLNMNPNVICMEKILDNAIIGDFISENEIELLDPDKEDNEITTRQVLKQAAEYLLEI